jgi:1,4-alpha-glucan branching enzyme
LMIAEDSSDRPMISAPTYAGGLGFNYKWNMGWMNDILKYMKLDREGRTHHHNLITFSLMYAFNENFVLPFSHDEVVHGKKSLLDKMPGDYWTKFANLRLLFAYLLTHPGKKLIFMGGELAQFAEWKDREELDWLLMDYDMHRKFHDYARAINHLYGEQKALWELDHEPAGFEWIDADNAGQSIVSFIRRGKTKKEFLIVVCNFTSEVYYDYRIGVPEKGFYAELLNTDREAYGGSGQYNGIPIAAEKTPMHGRSYCLKLTIPPFGAVILKRTQADISAKSTKSAKPRITKAVSNP